MTESILLLVTGLLCLLYTILFPYAGEAALSPMLMPMIASSVLSIAGLCLVLGQKEVRKRLQLIRPFFLVAVVCLFVFLLGRVHFILLATVFVAVLLYAFGEHRLRFICSFSLGISGILYIVFEFLLGVQFP